MDGWLSIRIVIQYASTYAEILACCKGELGCFTQISFTHLKDNYLNMMCYFQGHKLKEVYNLVLDVESKILRFLQFTFCNLLSRDRDWLKTMIVTS